MSANESLIEGIIMLRFIREAGVAVLAGASLFGSVGVATASSEAVGEAAGSIIQVPVHVPLSFCGISGDVVALFNATHGTSCASIETEGD
ncbi:chaplin [Streptomyces albireticuli]|nr:chaplin [Streptomyces albireticuli]MCD9166282.1 chaplin [Streptomyces albireticuli]MCD9196605.1 chaplin [Streptomyces albireticuli]